MSAYQNNIEITGNVNLKIKTKNLSGKMIKIMIQTIVPLGYSYVDNDDLKRGVIRFNKNIPIDNVENKTTLVNNATKAILSHDLVDSFQVIQAQLCPVEQTEIAYHCPIQYVNKNIELS